MSFVLEAVRDKPVALYVPSDAAVLQDYSGFGHSATFAGTAKKHASFLKGVPHANVFGNGVTATFPSTVFRQGQEDKSFSLEAVVRGVDSSAPSSSDEIQIVGNPGQMDGLVIDGTKILFVMKFEDAPESRLSYDLQQGRRAHVIGIHTSLGNYLYVNGVMVAEVSLTEEQQQSRYASASTDLSSGQGTSSQGVAVSAIGIYPSVLDQVAVSRHFSIGADLPDGGDVATAFLGERIPVSLSNANVFLDQWWSTEQNWKAAELFDVAVVDDELRPQFDENVSIPGTWYSSFALSAAAGTSVYGVSFNWDGEGAEIEVSLDGTTWESVERGVNVSIIPPGFNPTDKELQVRVSFLGGIEGDTSFLDNLNAVGIKDSLSQTVSGREVTYNSSYPEREYAPFELHDNWGVEIAPSGSVIISPDESTAIPARTIEMWVKRTSSGTNPTISATGTVYQNGLSATTTLVAGQWTLLHIVSASDITGSITINGPAQVGQVVVYDSAKTATDIAKIYEQYTGGTALKASDSTDIEVADSSAPVKIYAHDWSIQASG